MHIQMASLNQSETAEGRFQLAGQPYRPHSWSLLSSRVSARSRRAIGPRRSLLRIHVPRLARIESEGMFLKIVRKSRPIGAPGNKKRLSGKVFLRTSANGPAVKGTKISSPWHTGRAEAESGMREALKGEH